MKFTTFEQLKTWRAHLHQYPELSLQEYKTSEYLRQEITKLGMTYMTPLDTATIVFLNANAEQTVLLRSDIDALPIQEQIDSPIKSKNDGVMHACGHDGHMAMLLSALKELKALNDQQLLPVNVLFVFQPAEETYGGGDRIIKNFDFSPYNVTSAFALHVNPDYDEGIIATRSGELMASGREFEVNVIGKSAHVGLREHGINAMNAASQIFNQFQAIPTYDLDSKHTNIVHVGTFQSGEAENVVPNYAKMRGTIRTYDQNDLNKIIDRMHAICDGVAMATQTKISIQFGDGYPAVINDPDLMTLSESSAKAANASFILQKDPYLMAEDFSFYRQLAPIHYAFVGIRNDTLGYTSGLHTPTLQLRDEALIFGVDYLVQVILQHGDLDENRTSNY